MLARVSQVVVVSGVVLFVRVTLEWSGGTPPPPIATTTRVSTVFLVAASVLTCNSQSAIYHSSRAQAQRFHWYNARLFQLCGRFCYCCCDAFGRRCPGAHYVCACFVGSACRRTL